MISITGVDDSPGGASAATAPRLRRATVMSGKERRAHYDVEVESKSADDDGDGNMDEIYDLDGPFDSDMDHPSDEEMGMEEGEWQESFHHEEDDEESVDEKDMGGEDRGASFSFSNQPPAGGREQKRMYPAGGLDNMTWEDVSNYAEKQSERDHSNDYQVGTIASARTDYLPPTSSHSFLFLFFLCTSCTQSYKPYLSEAALRSECKKVEYRYHRKNIYSMFQKCFPPAVSHMSFLLVLYTAC